jgi:hypothetical protein
MEAQSDLKFIFYILLDQKIPEDFYLFDDALKKLGFTLIPIAIDQIQILGSISEQSHIFVISSSTDFSSFKAYNKNVRKMLMYLLKSDRITFFKLSSFNKLNDEKKFYNFKNYFFINYPQDVQKISEWMVHLFLVKSKMSKKWPGGKKTNSSVLSI